MTTNSSSRRQQSPGGNDEINGCLRNLLRDYNDRDTEAISRHIKNLRDATERADDDVVRTLFGGSVAKHTFVDGLSDVDVLFIVNDSGMSGQQPRDIIQDMERLFRQRLPNTKISSGDMAVTVTYSDGIEIQVLPAIRTQSGGVRIADPERGRWSNVLHPERFAKKLTEVNQASGKQVIPTVKLAKSLAAQVIPSAEEQIKGYHMESLGIEAFIGYPGPYDLRSMLGRFCDAAANAVLQPITDSTGQSRHVDEYMGPANSRQRQRAAQHFKDMAQRLNSCKSASDVADLFGESNSGGNNDNGGRPPKRPDSGNPPRGNARNAAAGSGPVALTASPRTFSPPSPYATQSLPMRKAVRWRSEYDLTPLSASNVAWLSSNQPGMRYDEKGGVIAGTFALRASWDPDSGRLTTNPWHPANPVIEDEYQLEIRLRYDARNAGGVLNRCPPVFETGYKTRLLSIARRLPLADLHMYPDGECCLGFNPVAPSAGEWDLPKFFEVDLTAWLYRLAYVERCGLERARQKLWPEYDHQYGPNQYLAQLRHIASSTASDDAACPCGSGVSRAQCHQPAIMQCRADGLM